MGEETQLKKSIKMGRPEKTENNIVQFPDAWAENLKRTNEGGVKNTINNFCIILENDEAFKGKIAFNELSRREEINNRKLENADLSSMKNYIEDKYGIYNDKKFPEALSITSRKHKYHPIKKYLEGLKWDGIKRADTAFADYIGAEPSEYNAMCLRLILYGAIERIYFPRKLLWIYVNN